ncbi:cytochrome C oxidase subunit IV family protein [bacterium]|nr:cytochrome C oxidase subunit IV family protein [bacterium]
MADTPEAIRKSVRTYMFVGGVLFLGTILTVLVATVPALDVGEHGFDKWDAILGLTIASIKASLVAFIFMHLNHEKKAVYWLFGSGLVMVCSLAGLTALALTDPIHDFLFYGAESKAPKMLASPSLR